MDIVRRYILLIILILTGSLSVRCHPTTSIPIPTATVFPDLKAQQCIVSQSPETEADLPAFIGEVYPPPNSIIDRNCYNQRLSELVVLLGGIHASIRIGHMVEPGDQLDSTMVAEMVEIWMDSDQNNDTYGGNMMIEDGLIYEYDQKGNVIKRYPGPHVWIYLPIVLNPGQHTVVVQAEKTNGAKLEYRWTFTVTQ